MGKEIERKFMLDSFPPDWGVPGGYSPAASGRPLEQAYLNFSPTVRVRRDGERCELCYKGTGRLVREEYNLPLDKESYERLLAKREGAVIRKMRYRYPLGALTAELDIFEGFLAGLRYVEVEFPSIEAAETFVPPAWFGRELTGDGRYTNAALAQSGCMPEL